MKYGNGAETNYTHEKKELGFNLMNGTLGNKVHYRGEDEEEY